MNQPPRTGTPPQTSSKSLFWLKWAGFAVLVFASSFLVASRDRHFSAQWAKPDLPTYDPFVIPHLTVAIAPADLDFLFSSMPESLYVFQKAEVAVNRTPLVIKAQMRIRGSHAWNWTREKPSFRLRSRGRNPILGRNDLNIAVADDPAMLANLITDHLAVNLQIPSPRTTLGTVTLNDDYKGLYHFSDPMNPEMMAFQGFPGIAVIEGNLRSTQMWLDPNLWQIQSDPADPLTGPFNCLSQMLKLVKTPVQLAQIDLLAEVLDIQRTASWSALLTAVASIRANDFFGQTFLFDKVSGKLLPAINDALGFGLQTEIAGTPAQQDIELPIYEMLTPLMNAFFRHPEYQFQRNRALFQLLNGPLSDAELARLVARFLTLLQPLWEKEPYPAALINVPILRFPKRFPVSIKTQQQDAARLCRFMHDRRNYLLNLLQQAEITVQPTDNRTTGPDQAQFHQYIVRVNGHSPIDFDFSAWPGAIFPDADFDGTPDWHLADFATHQRLYPGLAENPQPPVDYLMFQRRMAKFVLTPDFQTYLFWIRTNCLDDILAHFSQHGRNAITGERVSATILSRARLHPHSHQHHQQPPTTASGTVIDATIDATTVTDTVTATDTDTVTVADTITDTTDTGLQHPRPNPAVLHPWRKLRHVQN